MIPGMIPHVQRLRSLVAGADTDDVIRRSMQLAQMLHAHVGLLVEQRTRLTALIMDAEEDPVAGDDLFTFIVAGDDLFTFIRQLGAVEEQLAMLRGALHAADTNTGDS